MLNKRHFFNLVILVVAVLSLVLAPLPALAAGYPLDENDERIQAALEFLRNSEAYDASLWSGGEKTCYLIVAVAACGDDPHQYISSEGKSLVEIIEEGVDAYLKPRASAALAHEFYLMAIAAAGENPWDFGGVNVAGQLLDMFDGVQIGQSGIVNDDFWAVVSLVGAGVNPEHAAIQSVKDFILECQNEDGSWGSNVNGSGMGTEGDACDTANAILGLLAAGESPSSSAIVDGLAFIKSKQNDDGGFPYYEGTTASDVASGGRVLAAITAAGGNPTAEDWTIGGNNPFTHTLSLQQDDGGFAWMEEDASDGWMTTYVLPALTGRYWPVHILEEAAPQISNITPGDGAVITSYRPTISARFTDDASGIDNDSLSLVLDTVDVTAEAAVNGDVISFTPASNLSTEQHTLRFEVSDRAGYMNSREWKFTITPPSSGSGGGGGGGGVTIDRTAPVISSYAPLKDASLTVLNPEISISYSDKSSGIKTSTIKLAIDDKDVTSAAVITVSKTTYTQSEDFTPGPHSVSFTVSDKSGNKLTHTWSFTIEAPVIPEPEPAAPETPEVPATPAAEDPANMPLMADTPPQSIALPLSAFAANLDSAGRLVQEFRVLSTDKMVELTVFPGTLALDAENQPLADVVISASGINHSPEEGWCRIGSACNIAPDNAVFDQNLQLVFRYQESRGKESLRWDTSGNGSIDLLDKKIATAPQDFRIAGWDSQAEKWELLESSVDLTEKNVTAAIDHFSVYALLGPSALPLKVKSVTTIPENPTLGEVMTISAAVENPGQGRGAYLVPLKIDGYVEDSQDVTLEPGEYTLTFSYIEPYKGEHNLDILGYETSFSVASASSIQANWWESVDVIYYAYIGGAILLVVIIVGVIILAKTRQRKTNRF